MILTFLFPQLQGGVLRGERARFQVRIVLLLLTTPVFSLGAANITPTPHPPLALW